MQLIYPIDLYATNLSHWSTGTRNRFYLIVFYNLPWKWWQYVWCEWVVLRLCG